MDKNLLVKKEIFEASVDATKDNFVSIEILKYFIEVAIWSPSPFNKQPWIFKVDKNKIDIFYKEDNKNTIFNYNNVGETISCGCALETISIVATRFGIDSKIVYCNNKTNLIATIYFNRDNEKLNLHRDYLFHSIWTRRTNSGFYKRSIISKHITKKVKDSISLLPNIKISFLTERKKIISFSKYIYLSHNKYLKENASGITRIFYKIGFSKIYSLFLLIKIIFSSGVGLITVNNLKKETITKAGRTLQRSWLCLEDNEQSLQPISFSTFCLYKQHIENPHKYEIESKKLRDFFKLEGHEIPLFLFRLGQTTTKGRKKSRRKPTYQLDP